MTKLGDPFERISYIELDKDAVKFYKNGHSDYFFKDLANLQQKKEFLRDLRHEVIRRQLDKAVVGEKCYVNVDEVTAYCILERTDNKELDLITRMLYRTIRFDHKNDWLP